MKAAICYEAGKPLVIEEVTLDKHERGEVKVRVGAVAVCHSDLHAVKGELPGKLPGIAGHEVAGYVEEIGEGVTQVAVGDHVVASAVSAGCGHCYYCNVGLRHMCTGIDMRAMMAKGGHHINKKGVRLAPMAGPVGGFAEYTVVSQYNLAKIPNDLPMDRACLLACGVITGFGAVHNRAQVKPMSSVMAIGVGGVGMNVIQAAVHAGAYPIIAVDIRDDKLEMAKTFGATHTVNTAKEKDPADAVRKMTNGRGADYGFLTVGSMEALRTGFNMLGRRGMMVVIGIAMGKLDAFTAGEFIGSEKILTGSMMGSTRLDIDVARYAELYKAGQLKLDELIAGHFPLEKINDAIKSLEGGAVLRNIIMF
jgi:Zn-dependent alcohol dehydrogenase